MTVRSLTIKRGRSRNENGFNIPAVSKLQEELPRGVLRPLRQGVLEWPERIFFGQILTERLRKVGHLIPRLRAFLENPIKNLGSPIGRLAMVGQKLREL